MVRATSLLKKIPYICINIKSEVRVMADYPKDPIMLMSWTNMKLRDHYSSLDELCDDLGIDRKELEKALESAGFTYNEAQNKFW